MFENVGDRVSQSEFAVLRLVRHPDHDHVDISLGRLIDNRVSRPTRLKQLGIYLAFERVCRTFHPVQQIVGSARVKWQIRIDRQTAVHFYDVDDIEAPALGLHHLGGKAHGKLVHGAAGYGDQCRFDRDAIPIPQFQQWKISTCHSSWFGRLAPAGQPSGGQTVQ